MAILTRCRQEVRGEKPFSHKQPSAPQRILRKLTAKTDPLSTHVCIIMYFFIFIFTPTLLDTDEYYIGIATPCFIFSPAESHDVQQRKLFNTTLAEYDENNNDDSITTV